ncbi:MAG: ATP-binding cassette domain-containing protein, partial [Ilumatobacteraceae bacterium]
MTNTSSDTATATVEPSKFAGLETRGVHAWFGKHHALSNVSLKFPVRTVTGLIGPSGCGKSTFIRLLNRMHEFIPGAAMAGEVRLHGNDIYAQGVDAASIRLKVGMVFQKPNPFP